MRTEAAKKLYSYICTELTPSDRRAAEILRMIEELELQLTGKSSK